MAADARARRAAPAAATADFPRPSARSLTHGSGAFQSSAASPWPSAATPAARTDDPAAVRAVSRRSPSPDSPGTRSRRHVTPSPDVRTAAFRWDVLAVATKPFGVAVIAVAVRSPPSACTVQVYPASTETSGAPSAPIATIVAPSAATPVSGPVARPSDSSAAVHFTPSCDVHTAGARPFAPTATYMPSEAVTAAGAPSRS